MHDQEQARALILQFASRIFLAADNEDRAGQASKKTGRLFLVASQFMEVMRGLGEMAEELEERIRYAKWKASDIVKALNEGRQPVPGPPHAADNEKRNGGGHLPSLSGQFSPDPPSAGPSAETKRASPPIISPTGPAPETRTSPPIILPAINIPGPVTVQQFSPPQAPVSPVIDPTILSTAEKYARFAISAIQFEDVPTAIQNLELSLNVLRGLGRK